jgi:2-oxoglutarate ferredoxin oxidoreductase subunit beta
MVTENTVETVVADRPQALSQMDTHYCPGCLHGVAHRLIAEVLDELAIRERTLLVAPVFAYQGDGDLASIGTAEIIHAAVRGENITVIFINNAVYGMTGGQMAPTSLVGMVTTSSPFGRDVKTMGSPLRMSELIAQIDGATFVSRRSLHSPAEIRKAKKAIRRAFEVQMNHQGFSLVELLSNCPTNWDMKPLESLRWIETRMVPVFPLGDLKNAIPNNGLKGV